MGTTARTLGKLPPHVAAKTPGQRVEWRRRTALFFLEANQGHIACTGSVTLSVGNPSTTVIDARAGVSSHIGFTALTANAAAEAANLVVSMRGEGTFTISHTNNVLADRTYSYCILG